MKEWTTDLVIVREQPFDHDLHQFQVRTRDGRLLGDITPATIEDMRAIIADLDDGGCPVRDAWEDGMGNTCTMEGWANA